MFRIPDIKRIQGALAVTLAAVTLTNGQQAKEQSTPNETPWVVSVVHNVDVHKMLAKWREQQNTRIGVSGSSLDMIVSIATGLVVDQQGHVVARLVNVDPGDKDLKFSVTTGSGQSLPARLIGMDLPTGFAVLEVYGLKIDPPTFNPVGAVVQEIPVRIISSDFERKPDTVAGRLSFVPTTKRITGKLRPPSIYSRARGALSLLAPGLLSCNDGSVVIDENTTKVLGMAQYAGYGRAYLYPIELISGAVAKRVLERGDNVPAGWLGVTGMSVTQLGAAELVAVGLGQKSGFFVKELVPNSPALASGLMANDIIVGVEDLKVEGETDLSALIASSPAGRKMRVRAIRNREPIEVNVVLGARAYSAPDFASLFAGSSLLAEQLEGTAAAQLDQIVKRLEELDAQYQSYVREAAAREREEAIREIKIEMRQLQDKQRALNAHLAQRRGTPGQFGAGFNEIGPATIASFSLGFAARDLTKQLRGHFGVKNGVWVVDVRQGTPAGQAGLKAGDVITGVRGRAFTTTRQLQSILSMRGTVWLRIVRDREPMTITVGGQ